MKTKFPYGGHIPKNDTFNLNFIFSNMLLYVCTSEVHKPKAIRKHLNTLLATPYSISLHFCSPFKSSNSFRNCCPLVIIYIPNGSFPRGDSFQPYCTMRGGGGGVRIATVHVYVKRFNPLSVKMIQLLAKS